MVEVCTNMAILFFCREAFRSFFGEPSAKDTYVKVGVVCMNVHTYVCALMLVMCVHV